MNKLATTSLQIITHGHKRYWILEDTDDASLLNLFEEARVRSCIVAALISNSDPRQTGFCVDQPRRHKIPRSVRQSLINKQTLRLQLILGFNVKEIVVKEGEAIWIPSGTPFMSENDVTPTVSISWQILLCGNSKPETLTSSKQRPSSFHFVNKRMFLLFPEHLCDSYASNLRNKFNRVHLKVAHSICSFHFPFIYILTYRYRS